MTILTFSILLIFFSFIAGLIGAMSGLGGGVVVIPVLVLLFHINIRFAMGASLISVIATASGPAATYMKEGYTNLRIGIFLETAAVIGAFLGALLISIVSKTFLTILFSFVLLYSAYSSLKRQTTHEQFTTSHPWATTFKLDSSYISKNIVIKYHVQHVPLAFFIIGMAGILSGLLGIGSGILKVLAMDQCLQLPYKVSTATSNFMIGITAAVSAGIYFSMGYINPEITFPVMIGVVAGSFIGAKVLVKTDTRILRMIFSLIISIVGLQMLYNAITGNT